MPPDKQPLIGLVGPCASGKSTLGARLEKRGYRVKHIAQEHSYVRDMWKRITNPDVLIFLDASYPVTLARRNLNWSEADYAEQHRRLEHARAHADLYIFTDSASIETIEQQIVDFLQAMGYDAASSL
jgi:deoxyadenosine/deoxycytidine kinase